MTKKFSQLFNNIQFTIIPVITVLLSVFVSVLPYKVSNISLLIPLFTPMVVYFWSIYQPQNLPYIAVLLLGLLKDIMENNSFGMSSLCLLLFQVMVRSQKQYIVNNSFVVIWAGFIFFLSIILFIPLILVNFSIDIQAYEFSIIFSQWLITIFVYVPVHWMLVKLNDLNGSSNG